MQDDRIWPASDDEKTYPIDESFLLNPAQKVQTFSFDRCLGNEVVGVIDITMEFDHNDNSVTVIAEAIAYEYTGCNKKDSFGSEVQTINVPANEQRALVFDFHNSENWGGDEFEVDFTLSNLRSF